MDAHEAVADDGGPLAEPAGRGVLVHDAAPDRRVAAGRRGRAPTDSATTASRTAGGAGGAPRAAAPPASSTTGRTPSRAVSRTGGEKLGATETPAVRASSPR